MGKVADCYQALKTAVDNAADDVAKADTGNGAAGTRARKAMQDVKSISQNLRKAVIEAKASK
jgi:hypothetical protein